MYNKIKGTGVALITPFTRTGAIDYKSLQKIISNITERGVEYLVILGTTGESATITAAEKTELVSFVKTVNAGKLPLVLGIGGNNTKDVADKLKSTDYDGIDAILSVSPYYNKPQQSGIVEHYRVLADSSHVPLIMYNVPGRTGSNMLADTTLRLAEHENIAAIKEASGNMDQITQVLMHKPDNFMVISGDDNLTLPLLMLGASGVISVAANVLPGKFSEMVRLGLKHDFESARKLHFEMFDFINLLFADGSPAGAKAALSSAGLCQNYLRLPLVPVNPVIKQRIVKKYNQLSQN